jgi:hypothetical protein
MNTQELIKMTGRVRIAMNGEIVRDIKNLVVTEGKEWIADRMQQDTGSAVMGWMTIGTGTTAAAVGDSTCETQSAHQALTTSGGVVAGAVITFASTFAAGVGTAAITEACITNNTTVDTGDMLARTVFAAINKGALDTMTITWDITIS